MLTPRQLFKAGFFLQTIAIVINTIFWVNIPFGVDIGIFLMVYQILLGAIQYSHNFYVCVFGREQAFKSYGLHIIHLLVSSVVLMLLFSRIYLNMVVYLVVPQILAYTYYLIVFTDYRVRISQ